MISVIRSRPPMEGSPITDKERLVAKISGHSRRPPQPFESPDWKSPVGNDLYARRGEAIPVADGLE